MSESQTGSDELQAIDIWTCEERFCATALHQFSLHWETQLQEERKPPKAVESPKQSGHYQPDFFLLNLSPYGRHSALPTHRAVWGSHCYRAEFQAKSHARGVGYFLFVRFHDVLNLTNWSNSQQRTTQDLNDIFVPSWSHLIQFSFPLTSLPTLFYPVRHILHPITIWVIIHRAGSRIMNQHFKCLIYNVDNAIICNLSRRSGEGNSIITTPCRWVQNWWQVCRSASKSRAFSTKFNRRTICYMTEEWMSQSSGRGTSSAK